LRLATVYAAHVLPFKMFGCERSGVHFLALGPWSASGSSRQREVLEILQNLSVKNTHRIVNRCLSGAKSEFVIDTMHQNNVQVVRVYQTIRQDAHVKIIPSGAPPAHFVGGESVNK